LTLTFESENDVIVYALEKVISYARRTQQIFVAQCVWWLASIMGSEQGLVTHIDNLHGRTIMNKQPCEENNNSEDPVVIRAVSAIPRDLAEDQRCDRILEKVEQAIQESIRIREDLKTGKASRTTKTGKINPLASTKQSLRIAKNKQKDNYKKNRKDYSRTEGIEEEEIQRRKAAGECLRCAWPADRKGTHRIKDCIRPI
jgi:hypothetical protein